MNQLKSDHILVIGTPGESLYGQSLLYSLISKYKTLGIDIMLASHFPIPADVQKNVSYVLYDAKNESLGYKDYPKYSISPVFWRSNGRYTVSNLIPFRHDYAIWKNWQNAVMVAKSINKKYIHYIEYDTKLEMKDFVEESLNKIESFDACVFNYEALTPEWITTILFSIKIEIFEEILNCASSLDEYFRNPLFLLETNLIDKLKQNNRNIYYSPVHIDHYSSNTTNTVGTYYNYDTTFDIQFILTISADKDMFLIVIPGKQVSEMVSLEVYNDSNLINIITKSHLNGGEYICRVGKYGDKIKIKGDTTYEYDTNLNTFDEIYSFSNIVFHDTDFLSKL